MSSADLIVRVSLRDEVDGGRHSTTPVEYRAQIVHDDEHSDVLLKFLDGNGLEPGGHAWRANEMKCQYIYFAKSGAFGFR